MEGSGLQSFAVEFPFLAGVAGSFLGGTVATAIGAASVFLVAGVSERASNAMLAFAAGVMLAAAIFSLLLPGIEAAEPLLGSQLAALVGMIVAMAAGGLALWGLHGRLPHEHFVKGPESVPSPRALDRVWLFVLAIALHNFPEGLAIGFGAGSGDLTIGLGVTIGIGLQNIPEGLAVAAALSGQGYSRLIAFGVGALSGVLELLGGIVGAGLLQISGVILPGALGFAAGAMLFVIFHEVIPETHREHLADSATAALFAGFALMMVLDTALA
ncbi:MAG TPA: ZIP family metal transporter [Pelomicrobium sp.]|nr:ZIP family metal transporter [Pelomicrobium sp.]